MVGTSWSAWKCPICLCLFIDLFVLGRSSAHTFKQQTKLGNWQESLQDRPVLEKQEGKRGREIRISLSHRLNSGSWGNTQVGKAR